MSFLFTLQSSWTKNMVAQCSWLVTNTFVSAASDTRPRRNAGMPLVEVFVKPPRKRSVPRVDGTSRYSFFIGVMMSTPNLNWWFPFSQERVSRYSNWFVCWNFGRKSGEPMLVPPK